MMFWRRGRYAKYKRGQSWWRRFLSLGSWITWGTRLVILLVVLDAFYVSTIWPDWKKIAVGPVPKSSFIRRYEATYRSNDWPKISWHPVTLDDMPKHLQRAVVVAEDSRFWQHDGFDLIAFKEAMDHNLSEGRFAFGASTISQQTVKNLFLNPSRNPLRKWHELLLTWGMEMNLKKRRILELYLNIAEFDRGVYGVEAAAQHYWGIPASQLDIGQAVELAACLPSPTRNNPQTRTEVFERRVEKINGWLAPSPEQSSGEI
jgi:monofunctional biosynthetic peptidoglycan transglycosylase